MEPQRLIPLLLVFYFSAIIAGTYGIYGLPEKFLNALDYLSVKFLLTATFAAFLGVLFLGIYWYIFLPTIRVLIILLIKVFLFLGTCLTFTPIGLAFISSAKLEVGEEVLLEVSMNEAGYSSLGAFFVTGVLVVSLTFLLLVVVRHEAEKGIILGKLR